MSGITENSKQSLKMVLLATTVLAMSQLAFSQKGFITGGAGRLNRVVLVSIPDRKLAVIEDSEVIRVFPVAVGAKSTPSPAGEFAVISHLSKPTYYHPGVVIPPGKGNPLGTRWIGLDKKGYGIHGTNLPKSIGQAASHGCIRLRNRDVEAFFEMVSVGDAVSIRSERDEEIARIFGDGQEPAETILQGDESGSRPVGTN
ncbi:MAG TPA: L,D-transpeptidase [Terriglobales bacterium]|jgi:lipoprotein-anchoring transpeptidase ErfK/SrfK